MRWCWKLPGKTVEREREEGAMWVWFGDKGKESGLFQRVHMGRRRAWFLHFLLSFHSSSSLNPTSSHYTTTLYILSFRKISSHAKHLFHSMINLLHTTSSHEICLHVWYHALIPPPWTDQAHLWSNWEINVMDPKFSISHYKKKKKNPKQEWSGRGKKMRNSTMKDVVNEGLDPRVKDGCEQQIESVSLYT